jgi:hypothetical protein
MRAYLQIAEPAAWRKHPLSDNYAERNNGHPLQSVIGIDT